MDCPLVTPDTDDCTAGDREANGKTPYGIAGPGTREAESDAALADVGAVVDVMLEPEGACEEAATIEDEGDVNADRVRLGRVPDTAAVEAPAVDSTLFAKVLADRG